MGKVKFFLLVALVGLSITSLTMFFKGGRLNYNPVDITDALPQNVDMQLTGVNFTEVTRSGREWTMKADTLHYFKARNLMVLDRVRATFFSKDGPMHVTGDTGYYDKNAQKVRLVGKVKANDAFGRELSTREVSFDVKTSVLIAPGRFKLVGPKIDLQGQGLSVFTKDGKIKVLEGATLLIKSVKNLL